MTNAEKQQLISDYVQAYNAKDIEAMLANLAEDIVFENQSDGEVTMRLDGLEAFRRQAEQAAGLFTEREQHILDFKHRYDQTEIGIAYRATLAMDLPNGFKKGEELQLEGRSVFTFSENKISGITDIS